MSKGGDWVFEGISTPNYSQIPNELYDEIQSRISPGAFSVVSAIFREYFGWHATAPKPLSLSELVEKTGMTRPTVVRCLKEAEAKGVIVCVHGNQRTKNHYGPRMKLVKNLNQVSDDLVKEFNQPSKENEPDLVKEFNSLKEIKETPKQQQTEVRPEDTLQWRMLASERISTKIKRVVLDKHYPDEYVIGAILQTYARYPNGANVDDLRGQLANALRDGDGIDEPYRSLAELPAGVWAELITCARAVHARSCAEGACYPPPLDYLSPPARIAWCTWSKHFTLGPRASPDGHYAPMLKGVPEHLREAGLRADVDEWIAQRRAESEPT